MEHAVENTKHAVHRGNGPVHIPQAPAAGPSQHPLLQLQQQAGNQAVQELLRSGLIRAKLAISQPDDPEEHEADRVADQIMRSRDGAPISSPCPCSEGEETCEECKQKRTTVQRSAVTNLESISAPDGQQFLRSRAVTPPIRSALSTLPLPELRRKSAAGDRANAASFASHVAESPDWHGAPARERKTCIDAYGCAWCNESRGIMEMAVDHEHCAGDCVKRHEQTHVKDDTMCCERYGRCMANAPVGQNPCRDAWDSYSAMTSDWTECNAYEAERNCMLEIVNNRCKGGTGGLDENCCAELQQQLTFVDQKSKEHCPKSVQMPCPFKEDGSIMKLSTTPGTPGPASPTSTTASPGTPSPVGPSPGSPTPGSPTPSSSTSESAPTDTAPPPAQRLSRKCACRGDAEDQPEQNRIAARKPAHSSSVATSHRAVEQVLRSPGQPLDLATRAFFEPRFGHDFSAVRVHTDASAADSARSINAHAYTAGSNVVFAPGKFNPQSSEGRLLLAHELAHTVQQNAPRKDKIRRQSVESELPKDVDLKGASVAFDIPADRTLKSSSWHGITTSSVVTTAATTITLSVDSDNLTVSFSPALLVKPLALANMEWSGVTYNFAKASTSVNLSGGWTSPNSTAVSDITDFFTSLISGTRLATAGYDPVKDPDIMGTLNQIKANFNKTPSSGGDGITAADISNIVVTANISLRKPITADGLIISGAVTIAAKLRGSAESVEKSGPVVDSLAISGDSIIVQSDGADVAQIHALTVANGGAVTISSMTLLGKAKKAADLEQGLKGLLLITLLAGGGPSDRPLLANAQPNLEAEIVPGLTRAKIQDALTKAVRELIRDHADVIPGYDLTTVFGVGKVFVPPGLPGENPNLQHG